MDLKSAFQIAETTVESLACLLNAVFLAYTFRAKIGTKACATLFRSQSVLDLIVIVSNIMLLQFRDHVVPKPSQDSSDLAWEVECRLIFSQLLYWGFVTMSVYNLVALSIERCLCLCTQFWYKRNQRAVLRCLVGLIAVCVFFFHVPYCTTFAPYSRKIMRSGDGNGTVEYKHCNYKHYNRQQLAAFGVTEFVIVWILPIFVFVGTYSLIIVRLLRSSSIQASGNRRIGSAARRLTITSGVTCFAFVALFALDSVLFLIGTVTGDVIGSQFVQKLDSFLVTMNSLVNPIIFFVFVPSFRRFVFSCYHLRSSGFDSTDELSSRTANGQNAVSNAGADLPLEGIIQPKPVD